MSLRFSIVVPVYNNPEDLKTCIESLKAVDYPRDRYEVIVVDNNSTDNTAAVANDMGVTCLSETRFQSSYAARNTGIKAARGELIAFTDSDCVVDKNWLKEIDEASSDLSAGCLAGEILSVPPTTTVERFSDKIGLLRQKGPLSGWHFKPYAQTANAVYRREVFDIIGLFDPTTNSGGDAAIAWRMQDRANLNIRFVPDAIVYHHHRTSVADLYSQFRRYGGGKMSWALAQPDYRPPAIADLEKDVIGLFSKHMDSLEAAGVNDDVLFSALRAASQAAHLSGYLQDLLRYTSQSSALAAVPAIARERAATCNICGSNSFLPGPNGRLTNGKPLACAECGSLERHRIVAAAFKRMEAGAAAKTSCLFVGDNFRGAPEKIGFGDYRSMADLQSSGRGKRYDAVIVGNCLSQNKGNLAESLSAIVGHLHDESTLIIVDDINNFEENIAALLPNVSVYDLRVTDQVTNSAVPVMLLASGQTSVIRAFLGGNISL